MALQITESIQGSENVKACILFGEKLCSSNYSEVCDSSQIRPNLQGGKGKKRGKISTARNKSAGKILKEYLTVIDEVENFEEFDAVK